MAAFPMATQPGVLFTYGDAIYIPHGGEVSGALKAHEGVHFTRQTAAGMTPDLWWRLYLDDPAFRLAEEIPAHRAEVRAFKAENRDRNAYFRYARAVAARLAGPLYGSLITPDEARRRILA